MTTKRGPTGKHGSYFDEMDSCIDRNPDVRPKIIPESSSAADPAHSDSEGNIDNETPFHLTRNVSGISNRKFCVNKKRPWFWSLPFFSYFTITVLWFKAGFHQIISSTLLITTMTPTPSLVKTSL